jgi:hypothetical protein
VATTFFLGAGCSYGTLSSQPAFPPLAGHFGSELEKRIPTWRDRYPELSKVATHLGEPLSKLGLEEIWTCIDYHAKFPGAFAIEWEPRGAVVRELKACLLTLYGRTCDEAADALSLSDDYTLGKVILRMASGDTVVSFN